MKPAVISEFFTVIPALNTSKALCVLTSEYVGVPVNVPVNTGLVIVLFVKVCDALLINTSPAVPAIFGKFIVPAVVWSLAVIVKSAVVLINFISNNNLNVEWAPQVLSWLILNASSKSFRLSLPNAAAGDTWKTIPPPVPVPVLLPPCSTKFLPPTLVPDTASGPKVNWDNPVACKDKLPPIVKSVPTDNDEDVDNVVNAPLVGVVSPIGVSSIKVEEKFALVRIIFPDPWGVMLIFEFADVVVMFIGREESTFKPPAKDLIWSASVPVPALVKIKDASTLASMPISKSPESTAVCLIWELPPAESIFKVSVVSISTVVEVKEKGPDPSNFNIAVPSVSLRVSVDVKIKSFVVESIDILDVPIKYSKALTFPELS